MCETPSVVIYNPCFTPSSQPIPHHMPSSPIAARTKSCSPGRDHARSLFNNSWYRNFQKPTRVPTLRNWFQNRPRAFHGRSKRPSWKHIEFLAFLQGNKNHTIKKQTIPNYWNGNWKHLNSNFNEKLVLCGPTVSTPSLLHGSNLDPNPRIAKKNMEKLWKNTFFV